MQTNYELKKHNTTKIFRAMQRKERISRKELAQETGLSWGSVSAITGELLAKGVIVAEKEASAGGRPAETLSLHPDRFLQLGIDVNSVGLTFVVVNMQGKAVFSETLPLKKHTKDSVLFLLFTQTEKILSTRKNIVGISLAMQGKIHRKTGVSIHSNFSDWENVALAKLFEERFSLPTVLYHDPDCLLYYHLFSDGRLHGKKDGFVIRLDNGIGMARLLHGKLYNAGEVASYEFGQIVSVTDGREYAYGKRGCLEAYASIRGMREIYAERYGEEQDFVQDLQAGKGNALAVLEEGTTHLGIAIGNLFTLSSPEFILLDGVLLALAPNCFAKIEQVAKDCAVETPLLLCANYKKEAPAIGACLITLENNTEKILFEI